LPTLRLLPEFVLQCKLDLRSSCCAPTPVMASNANIIDKPLPREMQQHTYSIMHRVEETHWWFVGRRKIIESFIERVCLALKSKVPVREVPHILDVGCGTGANLEMLAQFG